MVDNPYLVSSLSISRLKSSSLINQVERNWYSVSAMKMFNDESMNSE